MAICTRLPCQAPSPLLPSPQHWTPPAACQHPNQRTQTQGCVGSRHPRAVTMCTCLRGTTPAHIPRQPQALSTPLWHHPCLLATTLYRIPPAQDTDTDTRSWNLECSNISPISTTQTLTLWPDTLPCIRCTLHVVQSGPSARGITEQMQDMARTATCSQPTQILQTLLHFWERLRQQ